MKNETTKEMVEVNLANELTQDISLVEVIISPPGLALLVCAGFLIWSSLGNGNLKARKHKLARAKWADKPEKRNARIRGSKQIRENKHNKVTLFTSSVEIPAPIKYNEEYLTSIPQSNKIHYWTDANRGVIVLGCPGSGKTYSFINPSLRSAIDQGFPMILYDNKYGLDKSQTAKIAGYALERGYEIYPVAPGCKESVVANLMDLIPSEVSAEYARQLSVTLNKNFKLDGSGGKGNPFFTNAGELLTQGIFQAAKTSEYPDILMCFAILSLDQLDKRIQNSNLNPLVKACFAQFLKASESPETAASIAGTTLGLFTRFLVPELLPIFCGKSSMPLELTGRQMVVFGMDDEKREVVAPLLASILHMLATCNLAMQRNTPLVMALDELPTIYLPSLGDWLNQKRENGLVAVLGAQNLSQLEKSYGKEGAETIFTGCSTKAFFNAGSQKAAKTYAEYIGREEVVNKNLRENTGAKGKTNLRTSPDFGQRYLFEPSQFNTLDTGRAVIISPGLKSDNLASLPLLEKIKLSETTETKLEEESVNAWHKYKEKLCKQSQLRPITEEDLELRISEAQRLLPLPMTKEQQEKKKKYDDIVVDFDE